MSAPVAPKVARRVSAIEGRAGSPSGAVTAEIRDVCRGIIAVLDNRVLAKRYGRMFLEALPEMELEVV
mgnify:CR=1 FL=1